MSLWQVISDLVRRPQTTSRPASLSERSADQRVQPEQIIAALLAGVNEAVLIVDPELQVKLYNDQALELFALDDITQPLRLVSLTRNQIIHALVRQALEHGSQREERVQVMIGQERTLLVRATPFFAPIGGEVLGAVVSFQDLTHLDRLERVRREFFANLSHDIRTPLTSILAYVETLLDGALADPAHNYRFLETIHKNATRLNALIDDYSNLAVIESGEIKLNVSAVDLAALCAELKSMFETSLKESDIELRLNVPAGLTVAADNQRLTQILINLVDNAIKFNRPGGQVVIEAKNQEGFTIITVRDTGVGITPQDLPRIFERLYRADKSRTPGVGGTGLGLSIVKHLAQAHGGEVSVESTPNVGSTFQIKIPLASPVAET